MILALAVRYRKYIAIFLYVVFYGEFVMAAEVWRGSGPGIAPPRTTRDFRIPVNGMASGDAKTPGTVLNTMPALIGSAVGGPAKPVVQLKDKKAFGGGPTQPEMQGFTSVNANNMVDLFSGDFSYNIPLLDVGGYPVNISYHSGQSMDEDASWVGLGWNVNPGSITRNMRGLPDDFNGGSDTIKKVGSIKANTTIGATVGFNTEIVGLPLDVGASLGVFHTTYNGWGTEIGVNASVNAGAKSHGPLSGGLSITDNSQNGLTINPSLSVRMGSQDANDQGGVGVGLQVGLPFNSRTGIKGLQLGLNDKQNLKDGKVVHSSTWNTSINFAGPTYVPTINLPMTNYNLSFTAKWGAEIWGLHPNLYLSGYMGREYIAAADTSMSLPAYGYMNFQNIGGNWAALTDFNREKEMAYREKPAIPHIAIPAYTYDVFTISGEGTGGQFRAYRGDIGFIADHQIQSKTWSAAASIDFGGGAGVHGGTDLNANYSTTKSGPWLSNNELKNTIGFRKSNGLYESVYFRNPGEKTINTTAFYNAIGGDDVVAPALYQSGNSDPTILATNTLNRYKNGQQVGSVNLTAATAAKTSRDKRSEVISYLTAAEAATSGLDKDIVHYGVNQFALHCCGYDAEEDALGNGTGLMGYYYNNQELSGVPARIRLDQHIFFDWNKGNPYNSQMGVYDTKAMQSDHYSIRWLGRVKAPYTGCYTFATKTDDGIRVWINDSLLINDWTIHGEKWDSCRVNLVAGKLYNIKAEYFEYTGKAVSFLNWRKPGDTWKTIDVHRDTIPTRYLYPPVFTDTARLDTIRVREDRVNNFRKASHISEVDVLNPDGRRYVYGIPVYNIVQKEVSFSVDKSRGSSAVGLTAFTDQENSPNNQSGKDGYYSREETPAYAHSFLLTGILSPDYVDVTGDGVSDDDLGDAVKFSYSKTAGIANPFEWRAPYIKDSANYSEGFKSYSRDDKAHYIYGTKELWYLHAIESKTMVANFTLQPRADLLEAGQRGAKANNGKAMCLKQIDLYSKADFMKKGVNATPIKTVHFEYSYELCRGINRPVNDSGKLTLKKIWFTYNGNDKGQLNPYLFSYHANNPRYRVNMTDKWGSYKDPLQNPGSSAGNLITNAEYPYSLQDSAAAAYNAGAWSLDSIKLPSGGRIKVNYESDDYAYVQNRRATLMCKLAGFGTDTSGNFTSTMYDGVRDHMYAYVKVPYAVSSRADVFARYLDGLSKIHFKLNVRMPTDDFGGGYDYVPSYASPDLSDARWYGVSKLNANIIWIKVKGVNKTGDGDGPYSPMAQTAINFLRLNLPSKAYPGSEVNDDLNLKDAVKIVMSMIGNVTGMLNGYTNTARSYGWCNQIDTARSYVRLDCPNLKKIGGGYRVKSVLIYDNWNAMTGKKETVYGQQYDYTTTTSINGVATRISSGVAAWEPSIGGEENPFHLPIEYTDRASVMAPAAAMYSEEPLGETFFPGPSVGYSKVRMRSIHTKGTRSANGYSESTYYTSYDFPTTWEYSLFDNSTKKRYKPLLQNFLRINAMNYLTMSQGFKVELNDMNGKLRTEALYGETDTVHPLTYTENLYKVDNQSVQAKHLNNVVMAIDPNGNIDTAATIGKDVEVMADMRDQTSTSIGANVNINVDLFIAGIWPIILPSLLNLYQKETNQFRSSAIVKIIQHYGILDSVVHIDKGSIVSSKNVLYDAETGEPLLVRVQNEFNDSIYQFTYPAHWAYKSIGPAYMNINAELSNLTVVSGKITAGLPAGTADSLFLSAGDELLVYSKQSIGTGGCVNNYAYFPDTYKLWVVDTSLLHGGPQRLFLVDRAGRSFSGNDVFIKVIRSGHRNVNNEIGTVTSLLNPVIMDGSGVRHLVMDSTRAVVNATADEFKQHWTVADKRTSDIQNSCIYTAQDSAEAAAEGCSCLKPFFNYLISHHLLFLPKAFRISVRTLVNAAQSAGYSVSLGSCPLLNANADLPFYSLNFSPTTSIYMARIGNAVVNLRSVSGLPLSLYSLTGNTCDAQGHVFFKDPTYVAPTPDTVTVKLYPSFTANMISMMGSTCPGAPDSLTKVDSTTDHLMVENSLPVDGISRNAVGIMRFDDPSRTIPFWGQIISANMVLQADTRGHIPGTYNNANSVHPSDSTGYSLTGSAGWFPYQPLDTLLYQAYYSPWFAAAANRTAFQNDTLNVVDYLNSYLNGAYASSTFILAQGSGKLSDTAHYDSAMVAADAVPPYLTSGYGNYYSTYYNTHYADSTKWPYILVKYTSVLAAADTMGAVLEYNSTIACTSITTKSCYSSITDTLVNPYQYGLLGNTRTQRTYVYYGRRAESDPYQATDIRRNGTIGAFLPYWSLQGGSWQPSSDTNRWVWNNQTNYFNRKGFELETMDALGRYSSSIYGFGHTMPIASIRNARYQESAYEGFEDYGYVPNSCDSLCPETKSFDFSAYISSISDSMAHTGLYSLRVNKNSSASISANLRAISTEAIPGLNMSDSGSSFAGVRASSSNIVPPFAPYAGKKMLVSAWVKERNSCTCQSYTRDHILIGFTQGAGNTSITLNPTGNMIEGWQRYESVVNIPANATAMTVTLQASDSSTTYFDDLRIIPFNAEMKSIVYNPVNLRMMAELDENNYATFYEYDDDGILIRVKKETERGVQTIKETRNALLKN